MKSNLIIQFFVIITIMIGFLSIGVNNSVQAANKFEIGDTVEVFNTGSMGLVVRGPNACDGQIGGKFDGAQGVVLAGPAYCDYYNRWKIKWNDDNSEGWSAEDWLKKVSTPTKPDLTVTSVNSITSAEPGGYIPVSWTVKNQGDASSGSFYNRICLASTPYGTDIALGNFIMSSIEEGSSRSDAEIPKIPETVSPGYYYITVYTDSFESISESNENNNINKESDQIHITSSNQPPTLSNGYVTPSSGETSTTFDYYVTYQDDDSDTPTTKYVYIDGTAFTMTKISGSYSSGAVFKYSTTLSTESHNYYFYFDDGNGHSARLPTSGTNSGPSVSQSAQLPQVTTNAASNTDTTTATLNGYLDDTGGESCEVWFEWGSTTSYGYSNSKQLKSTTGSFSTYISSLLSDKTYHFRACASNSKGNVYGSDKSFITIGQQAPTPAITSIDPPEPTANSNKQWISILGDGFLTESAVTLFIGTNTYPIPSDRTKYITPNKIDIYVGLTDSGIWSAQVTNPDNRISNIYPFTVKSGNIGLAAIDKQLLDLIDEHATTYYDSAWNLNIEQYKAWLATIANSEGGRGGYTAHSQKAPGSDIFDHREKGNSFRFSTGIGPFQLDRGQIDNWHNWPTIKKLNPEEAVKSVLNWHYHKFKGVEGTTLAMFALNSAWYGVDTNKGDPSSHWNAVTGTNWETHKNKKVDLNWNSIKDKLAQNANNANFLYENNVKFLGSIKWKITESETDSGKKIIFNSRYDTYQIIARNDEGNELFKYYYTHDPENQIEVWVLDNSDDNVNKYKYIFVRDYSLEYPYGAKPQNRYNSIAGDTLTTPAIIIGGAQPIITSGLKIGEPPPYYVGNSITAVFTIKNQGDKPITFDKLTVGGRLNGECPNNKCPDFSIKTITLQPDSSYQYTGYLTLTQTGKYHFFIAYYIENPTIEEKNLLDENNWNTCVDLDEGLTENDRTIDFSVNEGDPTPTNLVIFTRGELGITERGTGIYYQLSWDCNYDKGKGFVIQEKYIPNPIIYLNPTQIHWPYPIGFNEMARVGPEVRDYRFTTPISDIYSAHTKEYRAATILANGQLSDWSKIVSDSKSNIKEPSNPEITLINDPLQIKLTWKDMSKNEIGFYIYRWEASGAGPWWEPYHREWSLLATVNANTESYIDTHIILGYSYEYVIKAFNDNYLSASSYTEMIYVPVGDERFLFPHDYFQDLIIAKERSPVELRIYDSFGNISGVLDGEIKEEIPNSIYCNESNSIIIFYSNDSFLYELIGLDYGKYGLTVIHVENGNLTVFNATDIPTSYDEIHHYEINWDNLTKGEKGTTLYMDSDSDGTFEEKITGKTTLQPPISDIQTTNTIEKNSAITFNASDSYDIDGNITLFKWYFGDGNIGLGQVVSHTYSNSGEYMVTLMITDNDGLTSTYSMVLEVEDDDTIFGISTDDTPGFELILVICAVMIIWFFKRKNEKKNQ